MEREPYGQADVEFEVLDVLQRGRVMTTQEVTQAVKKRLLLSKADAQQANKRENESKIDQIIANALQKKRRLCRDGLIERVDRGEFRITDAGLRDIAGREALLAKGSVELDKLFPDADWD
jgi:hypothetical protein